ncbi:DoxX family membrane protein [Sinomonas gamaensis]|jgi:uncharacterized membrane protein YphA (DoxX/SURF4 family)|uniref:DoxX family membrane protein n=1 Tax=Sinomonas gamaensis TaxID=2565624 RepID=UPI001109E38D|nr:DoxX family membrane protein [Sinomonas gamaensis]
MAFSLSRAVLRLATGAYLLNSGISKLSLDEESAGSIQDMASNAVPQVKQLPPATFGKVLAAGEIALGGALLLPLVPTKLAALGLTGFGSGLVAVYAKTPGLTQGDGIRPTQAGISMAKDTWLAAIGLALLLDRKRKAVRGGRATKR